MTGVVTSRQAPIRISTESSVCPVHHRAGPGSDGIKLVLDRLSRVSDRDLVCIGGNADWLADYDREATERQIDGRAIPITKLDAPAGRYGNRIDGPTTVAGKQNGPDAGDPCDLGHIAGERDAVSFRERLAHAHKSTDAALAVETAKMVAGAPNGPDAEPLGSNCIDLPIAVGRYQDLCLEGRTPEKGAS